MTKSGKVLELLRGSTACHSGEELATRLGISRSAVWKQIEQLRKVGYLIDGSPRLGYLLKGVPDEPVAEEIGARLPKSYPGEVLYYGSLASSNDEAKRRARAGAVAGTIIVAGQQTTGHGRLGREWLSPPGGLWLSVILRPQIALVKATRLAVVTAVVVARALEEMAQVRPAIKWPNDILLGDKKIAGILIEISAEMETLSYAVVGVGINANLAADALPPSLAGTATSLLQATGRQVDRAHLAAAIGEGLLEASGKLYDEAMNDWISEWDSRSAALGKVVTVRGSGTDISGIAQGIDSDGCLLILTQEGGEVAVRLGEASLELPGR